MKTFTKEIDNGIILILSATDAISALNQVSKDCEYLNVKDINSEIEVLDCSIPKD
jgi:hypothetical protein